MSYVCDLLKAMENKKRRAQFHDKKGEEDIFSVETLPFAWSAECDELESARSDYPSFECEVY